MELACYHIHILSSYHWDFGVKIGQTSRSKPKNYYEKIVLKIRVQIKFEIQKFGSQKIKTHYKDNRR